MVLSLEELQLLKNDVQVRLINSRSEQDDLLRTNILAWADGQIQEKIFKREFKDCSKCGTPFPRGTECPVCRF